jgi:hypothetical protein
MKSEILVIVNCLLLIEDFVFKIEYFWGDSKDFSLNKLAPGS